MADSSVFTLELLKELVKCSSVTPSSAGAIELLEKPLLEAGFDCKRLPKNDVENLLATHGSGSPELILCGHIDVVPPGDETAWSSDPFVPLEKDGKLYGRGTTDMKGGVAALVTAAIEFVKANPDHPGTIALAFTSDEEGDAVDGIRHVVETLADQKVRFKYGLVGEPSSAQKFGDTLRVGRRGVITGRITVTGVQGHAAYPHLCKNPIPELTKILSQIQSKKFEKHTDCPEITTFQVVKIIADSGADNVVPATAHAVVNFRFVPQDSLEDIKSWMESICQSSELECECKWDEKSNPYFTGENSTIGKEMTKVATEVNGFAPSPSMGGGTSDGRFLADICDEVVEFGSVGKTMHQIDEHIVIAELAPLVEIYTQTISNLLNSKV